MMKNKLWLKCAAVAISFYAILYIFLAQYYNYFNIWLISILLVLAVGDVWGLRWWINKFEDKDTDEYP